MKHMIYRGRIPAFPRIIYSTKEKCDCVVAHLLKVDPKMYEGISSQPYIKQLD